jgi:hypothetical protein
MCIPHIVARQRLGKNVTAATNTHAKINVGRVAFNAVRLVSKESKSLVLPRTSCSNNVLYSGLPKQAEIREAAYSR